MDEKILKSYCQTSSKTIGTPFSIHEKTYATDGRIIIAVPFDDRFPYRDNAPGLIGLPFDHDEITDWVCLPELTEEQIKSRCRSCHSNGFTTICEECSGEGEVSFSNEFNHYDVTCNSCDGDGDIACSQTAEGAQVCTTCFGTRIKSQAVNVGRNCFDGINTIYIQKIKKLPGAQFSLHGDDFSCFRFRFDGGVGLIMPMRIT